MYICVIVSTVDVNDCIFCVNEQQKVYILMSSCKKKDYKKVIQYILKKSSLLNKNFDPRKVHHYYYSNLIGAPFLR